MKDNRTASGAKNFSPQPSPEGFKMATNRHGFSNEIIDIMCSDFGKKTGIFFTREVPKSVQHRILGDITVAEESEAGRGAPVFDIYSRIPLAPGLFDDVAISMKIGAEEGRRTARNAVLTTGTEAHIGKVLSAARSGASIPVQIAHQNKTDGQWVQVAFDFGRLLRTFEEAGGTIAQADGSKGNVVVINTCKRTYKNTVYEYVSLRVNLAPAMEADLIEPWEVVDFPHIIRPE